MEMIVDDNSIKKLTYSSSFRSWIFNTDRNNI